MFSRKKEVADATAKTKEKKPRAWELDFLRGLSIIMVFWDHTMYDCAYMFGYSWKSSGVDFLSDLATFARSYENSQLRVIFWPVFVFIFFFVSGICTAFSKNNFIRGLKLAIVAGLLTLATYLIGLIIEDDSVYIQFGVLHCLALSILLFAVLQLIVKLVNKKENKWVYSLVYLVVTGVLILLNKLYNVPLNDAVNDYICVEPNTAITGMFVFTRDWWTADYFPLLPFFIFFMGGATLAPILYPNKKSLLPKLDGKWNKVFTIPGRYSLFVYLGTQVVTIGILALITLIVTGELPF